MQKNHYLKGLSLCLFVCFSSCTKEDELVSTNFSNSDEFAVEVAFPGESGIVKKGSIFGQLVEFEVINDHSVFEGDIILSNDQLESPHPNQKVEGTGRSNLASRWQGGIVYYTIASSLPNKARVTNAIAHWEANTNVRFRARTTQRDYITFRSGSGCSSNVGRSGGQQFINLASGCSTGNTIHEIGHAMGLWHEQSRADRDNFIKIIFANIQAGTEQNFRTYVQQGYDGFDNGSLDLGSIMMYPSSAFSANGKPTITRLDGSTFSAQRNGLSTGDRACVRVMYPTTP